MVCMDIVYVCVLKKIFCFPRACFATIDCSEW
jgi:hypothetical protein